MSIFLCAIILLLCIKPAISKTNNTDAHLMNNAAESLVVKIDQDNYAIGNLKIDKRKKEIVIPGHVNMNKGVVEYLAVSPAGKTHEAILVLNIQPLHLQVALLLLGLEYGQNLGFQGDTTMPSGDSVSIYISWETESGDTVVHPVSKLIYDIPEDSPVPETRWIFTGSMIHNGMFMADVDGSIIATYSDPVAILNNPMAGRTDDTVYGINKTLIPAQGHKIIMIIKAL